MHRLGFLSIALIAFLSLKSSASTFDYRSATPDSWFGTGLQETYDVAVLINDPSLKGAKVTGIKVSVPENAGLSQSSGWLSRELSLKTVGGRKTNVPDIIDETGSIADGFISVCFSRPYECDGRPFYAGYSFTVDEKVGAEKPVAVCENAATGNLYIHTSRKYSAWKNVGVDAGMSGTPVLMLEAEIPEHAAAFSFPELTYLDSESRSVECFVSNHGQNPLRSIAYEYRIGECRGEGEMDLDVPAGDWTALSPVTLPVNDVPACGKYDAEFIITKVNGMANDDAAEKITAPISVLAFHPVNRPLAEEYTGLWCGWCPAGYVMLEQMNADYGQDFVGVAYHNGDPMACIPTSQYPSSPGGFPKVFINRKTGIKPLEMREEWNAARSAFVPAQLSVSIESDTEETLTAHASARFAEDIDNANYKLSYMLVADGLTNPRWSQHNEYSGDTSVSGPFWNLFTEGGEYVKDLVFNDVVLLSPNPKGVSGSIPSGISAGEEFTRSFTFHLDEIKNESGSELPVVRDRLRAVVVLIDGKSGVPVTAAKSPNLDGTQGSGVSACAVSGSVTTVWYDLQGRCVQHPGKGIWIRMDIDSEGNVSTRKTMVR